MLIASQPPPMPLSDTSELCYPGSGVGMGVVDFVSPVAGIIGAVGTYFGAKASADAQNKATKLQAAMLKAATQEQAREFARQQAEALVEPYETARLVQIATLAGVGLAAVAVSIMFVRGAMERR